MSWAAFCRARTKHHLLAAANTSLPARTEGSSGAGQMDLPSWESDTAAALTQNSRWATHFLIWFLLEIKSGFRWLRLLHLSHWDGRMPPWTCWHDAPSIKSWWTRLQWLKLSSWIEFSWRWTTKRSNLFLNLRSSTDLRRKLNFTSTLTITLELKTRWFCHFVSRYGKSPAKTLESMMGKNDKCYFQKPSFWAHHQKPFRTHMEVSKVMGYAQFSSICRWDFPWNKPSSYGGSLISGTPHLQFYVASKAIN